MGSYLLVVSFLLHLLILPIQCKPVDRREPQTGEGDPPDKGVETGLAYDNYLRQVVDVLESDPEFKKRLESANTSEIMNGDIAMHLDLAGHAVRTALDELKRQEIVRLQELARLQMQAGGRGEGMRNFEIPTHLDLKNPHSFEMADLKNLILKTTADLAELDNKKNAQFKEYEMEKEYEKKKHLSELSEEDRKKEEARLDELKKKHADHPKLNHPGSKDQFEEVWNKADQLEDQEFNPRTFFFKHDLNGDYEWNIEEVEALLQLELDKVYDSRNSPEEDDPLEREQEMSRMRTHIFTEMDLNGDYRITFNEFENYTGKQGDKPEFERDEGWKTVDDKPVFSDEEYQQFIESHHEQPSDLKFQSEHVQQQQGHQPQLNQQLEQHQPQLNQQQEQHQPQLNQQQEQHQPQLNQQQEQHQQLNQQQEQHQPQLNQHQEAHTPVNQQHISQDRQNLPIKDVQEKLIQPKQQIEHR